MTTLYNCSVTFEHWTTEDIEAGETYDRGFVSEDTDEQLADILARLKRDHTWESWSDTSPGPRSWLVAQPEENMITGVKSGYSARITRSDGLPLAPDDLAEISEALDLDYCPPTRRTGQ